MDPAPTVAILQRRLTHYRVPLFRRMRTLLAEDDVNLMLVHGQPTPSEATKKDEGHLDWAIRVKNRYWKIGSTNLCWQPLPVQARRADLIVITQENSLISNYPLLLKRRLGSSKVAFWGHGANLQSNHPNGARERFKRWSTKQVDWWFAYTGMSVELVRRCGFPPERITNLENAIDVEELQHDLSSIDEDEITQYKMKLGLNGMRIGLFLGSLHLDKRLDFLIDAADLLHAKDPHFRLLIVGDGPMRDMVCEACTNRAWCLWLGAKAGREKALILALADVLLNPGMVGLVILDSFAAGTPLVTTDCKLHSPEIAYLRHEVNGIMTTNSVQDYVDSVQQIFNDSTYRARLQAGCKSASIHYTINNMACNFCSGLLSALSL